MALSSNERAQLVSFLLQTDATEPEVADAATLQITSPSAGISVDAGETVQFAIDADLPQIVRVNYRVNKGIVASATAPPWTASWNVDETGDITIHADMLHDMGQFNPLSPPVSIHVQPEDHLFSNGFEP